jgi:excisionase family DNA binding protein
MITIPDPATRATLTVEEVSDALGISRASAYEGVRSGEIPSIRVGRRIVVPTAALRRLLQLDAPAVHGPG